MESNDVVENATSPTKREPQTNEGSAATLSSSDVAREASSPQEPKQQAATIWKMPDPDWLDPLFSPFNTAGQFSALWKKAEQHRLLWEERLERMYARELQQRFQEFEAESKTVVPPAAPECKRAWKKSEERIEIEQYAARDDFCSETSGRNPFKVALKVLDFLGTLETNRILNDGIIKALVAVRARAAPEAVTLNAWLMFESAWRTPGAIAKDAFEPAMDIWRGSALPAAMK